MARDFRSILRDMVIFFVSALLVYWYQDTLIQNRIMSGDNLKYTIVWAVFVLIAIVCVASLYFIIDGIFLAPREMWVESELAKAALKHQIADLNERLSPRLSVSLPNGDGITRIAQGNTSETRNGHRQTVLTASEAFLCLHVQNLSEAPSGYISGKLIGAWKVGQNGEKTNLSLVESVELLWQRDIRSNDIFAYPGAREAKRLYIAKILPNGSMFLHKPLNELPLEYHQIFNSPGQYLLQIQLNKDSVATKDVLIQVTTKEAPVAVNTLPTVTAKAVIVDSNIPPQSPQDTEPGKPR